MGVHGLTTYYCTHSRARKKVSLQLLAQRLLRRTGKKAKLLCDYLAVLNPMIVQVHEILPILHQESSFYCDKNFEIYARKITSFVKVFQRLGIDLVFFVDGPHGVDELQFKAKFSTLKDRYMRDLQAQHDLQQEYSMIKQSKDLKPTPALLRMQSLMTLESAGVEIIYCLGEADQELAHYARSHPEVCGILSTDSDFAVIQGSTLFPYDLLKFTHGLVHGVHSRLDKIDKTQDITCETVSPSTLASALGIKEEQLPDLAILCGNDFTKHLNHQLTRKLKKDLMLEATDVKSVARWLQGKEVPLINYRPFDTFCNNHPEYKKAVMYTYNFYSKHYSSLGMLSSKQSYNFYLVKLLGVSKSGIWWHDFIPESLTLGSPCIQELLLPLRKVIYFLLGVKSVREFGRTQAKSFAETCIFLPEHNKSADLQLSKFRELSTNQKLLSFPYLIVNALKFGNNVEEIGKVPTQVASECTSLDLPECLSSKGVFVCSCLQLIAYLNQYSTPRLNLLRAELDALLITCLSCCVELKLPHDSASLIPSIRSTTIKSWFLRTLSHAYCLATLLDLSDSLPQPKDLFSPMVFLLLHSITTQNSNCAESREVVAMHTIWKRFMSFPSVTVLSSAMFTRKANKSPTLQSDLEILFLFADAVTEVVSHRDALTCPKPETVESPSACSNDHKPLMPHQIKPSVFQCRGNALPVEEHRCHILHLVANHQVVCIEGETGSGKSSRIPQFILNEAIYWHKECKILVSQPNSITAIKLAERVSHERREDVGITVGYGTDHEVSCSSTRIVYCTREYMLQTLIHQRKTMVTNCEYTHIILDEIHERSADADFTLFLIRKFASEFPYIRVILMSATMQSDLFINYFQEKLGSDQVAGPYSVGKKRFSITIRFIDELHDLPENDAFFRCRHREEQHEAALNLRAKLSELSQNPELLSKPVVSNFTKQVCTELIIFQAKPGKSILVFLPGFNDISGYHKELTYQLCKRHLKKYFSVFVFHSQVPCEEQTEAFQPPPQKKAYVILSSKMAESSFTFPNLEMVINFGFSRVCEYQLDKHISRLVTKWCSRASCAQRVGRVGRVSEGTAIHLFTRQRYESLNDFDPPEILISPLAKHLLRAKDIAKQIHIPLPTELLKMLIEPPSILQMEAALTDLVEIGAVKYDPAKGVSEDADTTLLGKFSLALPLDLRLSKMVLLGIFFGCPLDAIVMAAALSLHRDVFSLPTQMLIKNMDEFCRQLKRSMESRTKFDAGLYSTPIMNRNLFIKWLEFRNDYGRDTIRHEDRAKLAKKFARMYSVGAQRLLNFEKSVCDIALAVLKFVPNGIHLYTELETLAAVIISGSGRPEYTVPGARNICKSDTSTTLYFCSDHNILKMLIIATSPVDILYGERELESSDATERQRATAALQAINDAEYDIASTVAMDLRHDTDSDSDTELTVEESSTDEESSISEVDSESDEALEVNKSYDNYICMPHGLVCVSESSDSEESNSIDECVTEETLQSLMKILPMANNTCTKIVKNIALVQFVPYLKLDRDCEVCVESTVERGSIGGFASQSLPEHSEISEEVKFFWHFTERRETWQVEGFDAELPSPFHPCALTWHRLTAMGEYINTEYFGNWRNPTAFVCKLQQPTKPYFAVTSDLLGTHNPFYMFATSITILPQTSSALLMMLSFQPFSSKLELLTDSKQCMFIAAKLNSREVEGIDTHFSKEDVIRLNRLRKAVSHAIASIDDKDFSIASPVIGKIPHLLQDVLKQRTIGTEVNGDDSTHVLSTHGSASPSSCHRESNTELVWETVTPGYDYYVAHKVAGHVEYYPQLHCSFVDCTPHLDSTEEELVALKWDVHYAETSQDITNSGRKQPEKKDRDTVRQRKLQKSSSKPGRKLRKSSSKPGRKLRKSSSKPGRKLRKSSSKPGQLHPTSVIHEETAINSLPSEHEWVTWFEQPDEEDCEEDSEGEYREEEYDLRYKKLYSGNFTCKSCNKHFKEEQDYHDHHRKCYLCNFRACIKLLRKHEFKHTYTSFDVPLFGNSTPSKSVTCESYTAELQKVSQQMLYERKNSGCLKLHRKCKKWNLIACRDVRMLQPYCKISSGRNNAAKNITSRKQICEPCSRKGFKSQRSYQAHLKSHIRCDICGLEACPKVLTEHRLTHTEILEFDASSNTLSYSPFCEPLAGAVVSKPIPFQLHVQPKEPACLEETVDEDTISHTDPALASTNNHVHSEGEATVAITDVTHECEDSHNDTEGHSTSDLQGLNSSHKVQQPSHKYKPGSEMHMVEYFKDYIEENGGEASISSLRRIAFQNFRKEYSGCPFLSKNLFKSYPQDFIVVEGAGFCRIKLGNCATEAENYKELVIPTIESSPSICHPDTSDHQKNGLATEQGSMVSVQQDALMCSPLFLGSDSMHRSLDMADKEPPVPKATTMLLVDPDLNSGHHSEPNNGKFPNVDSPSINITADKPNLPRSESNHIQYQGIPGHDLPEQDQLLTNPPLSAVCATSGANGAVVVQNSMSEKQPALVVRPHEKEDSQDNMYTGDDSTPDYQFHQPVHDHKTIGSDMHLVMYLKDYIKNNNGEASITSLRRIPFRSYQEKYGGPPYLSKDLFKSYSQDFKLVEGAGFCRIKVLQHAQIIHEREEGGVPPSSNPNNPIASVPNADEDSGIINYTSSIRDVCAQHEKDKCQNFLTAWVSTPATLSKVDESGPSCVVSTTDVTSATKHPSVEFHEEGSTTVTVVKPVVLAKQLQLQSSENEASTKHTHHQQHATQQSVATAESSCKSSGVRIHTNIKAKGTSNVHFVSGVKFVDGNENTQKDVNVDTKGSAPPQQLGQSGNTIQFASVPYRPPERGSKLHLVEFLRDFLEQNGGEARLGVLRKCAFNSYQQKYSQCSYLGKKFLRSHPEYFDISDGTNSCIVKLHKPIPPTSDATTLELHDKPMPGSWPATADKKREQESTCSEQDHIVDEDELCFSSIADDCAGPTESSCLSQLKSMVQETCTAHVVNPDGSMSSTPQEAVYLDTSLESQASGSTEHIVKYFKEYLSTHGGGDGCHVDELMEVFDLKYKQECALPRQPLPTKVNKQFFRTRSDVFRMSRRGIVRLREEITFKPVSQQTAPHLPQSKSGFLMTNIASQPLQSGLPNRGLPKTDDSLLPLKSKSAPKNALLKVEDIDIQLPVKSVTNLPMRGLSKSLWPLKTKNSLPKSSSPRGNEISKSRNSHKLKVGDEAPKSRSSAKMDGVSQQPKTRSVSLKVDQAPISKRGLLKADDVSRPHIRKTKSDLPWLKHASQAQQSKSAHDVQHSALSQVIPSHIKGDPFTPQHVVEYFSSHLSRYGECSVEELKKTFERKYKKQYIRSSYAIITFVSEMFFRKRSDLFEVTTSGTVKLKRSARS